LAIDYRQTDNCPSQLRNKFIVEAFYLTKNIENYGSWMSGIRKELEEYKADSILCDVTIAHYKNQPQKNIHVSWQT
jgi:predicted HTH transcriptional regulator